METILTPQDLKDLPGIRRINPLVDDTTLNAYLSEVEMLYIRPVLGDELYAEIALRGEGAKKYATLLAGGAYKDCKGRTHYFAGLRTAIAYYAYSQYVLAGDMESTRYGLRLKEGEHSTRPTDKERSTAYNNALEVAWGYLSDCLAYLKEAMGISQRGRPRLAGAFKIRKIG